ncbi:MAG: terpene utilization protein AtuA, partial [Sulfitobacter pontiacus]|uniref:AtuA-related protein n=3 Tax=Pseudomonadota TaxID=1224 RepID=UPI0032A0A510
APSAEGREAGPDAVKVRLVDLAWGRSGDKGDIANIGILARKPDYLPYIRTALTEEVVKGYFAHLCNGVIERFDLPGSNALNFLLHESLGGGGIASVRIDPQGKGFAQMLLDIEIPVPADLAARDGLRPAKSA